MTWSSFNFQGFSRKIHSLTDSLIHNCPGFIGPNWPPKKVRNISRFAKNRPHFFLRIQLVHSHFLRCTSKRHFCQALVSKIFFRQKIHNPQYPRPFYHAQFSVFSQRRHNHFGSVRMVVAMQTHCMRSVPSWPRLVRERLTGLVVLPFQRRPSLRRSRKTHWSHESSGFHPPPQPPV